MTRIGHLEQTTRTSWKEKGYDNPIHLERFEQVWERRLAKCVGVTQFGVNVVELGPGSYSALRHWHEREDEFVYVISGRLVLVDESGEHPLVAGDFAGFPAGEENGHHLVNRSNELASYLVVGSRKPGEDTVHYPEDDLPPMAR